jgi:glycine betaine/proline transport system ATP-binding protein
MSATAVSFEKVDIVFGKRAAEGLALLDRGATRNEILAECGAILGVADASLEVGEGEITVLMGLSGSGKSTLMRAVNGLNKPVRGRVLVKDGEKMVDGAKCTPDALRRIRMNKVAMVFQQFALLPWRTVAENAGFGLELAGVKEAERKERVKRQLELVGLAPWSEKFAHELSGGMQQRVGLARAFATEAPILLMDEPFSALDPLIRARLQDELLELQRQLRRTIIFVSHDLDEALKIGTRIAIMESGRIVQYGVPQDIVLKPANDYVRDFVAHMNPLNVLRAQEVMVPFASLPRSGANGAAAIGDETTLSESGEGWRAGEAVPVVALENVDAAPHRAIITVTPETPLRALIDARLRHTGPFVIRQNGAVTGLIRDEDLFRCLTNLRSSGEAEPAVVAAAEGVLTDGN